MRCRKFTRAYRALLLPLAIACLGAASSACGGDTSNAAANAPASAPAEPAKPAVPPPAEPADAPLPPPAYESALPESVRASLGNKFTGDLDQMVTRGLVRIGVTFNRTIYFVDHGEQRGMAYELGKAFEDELNRKFKTGDTKISVYFVPLPRDLLPKALTEGKVDLVAAQVTVRPELQALVDFTNPTRTNVSEVVVTGPGAPPIASVEDLSGKSVYARKDGKYYESLRALNDQLKAKGKAPVAIAEVPGNLEDDDLLEMTNAGLLPIVVVDDYLAEFWKKIFTNLTVHQAVKLRSGANLAVAIRKNSPGIEAELNAFLAKFGLGTAFGNIIQKRYLVSTGYAKQATSEAERKKFLATVALFRKYGGQYDVPYLLMAAQGYQESQLDQNAKSRVGAVGLMQVMPPTGREMNVGDIRKVDPNIHAGVKYMRFMMDRYYKDDPMDRLNKGLFTLASYNAGPARVRQLRKEAQTRGLDPNVWFGNVEQIASERIGRETVTYVSNIYKYYVAYQLVEQERARREAAKSGLKSTGK
jgi:membrane-bound lytic murein transglycosylase MltF